MKTQFECKIKYTKIDEKTGKEKRVTETYLVDAINFSEAETRIYTEMEKYISGEFTVLDIKRANYTDVWSDIGERFYHCRVSFMSIDEAAGKEKKVTNSILALADNVDDASNKVKQGLSGMTVDFETVSVAESKIIDVFV